MAGPGVLPGILGSMPWVHEIVWKSSALDGNTSEKVIESWSYGAWEQEKNKGGK